jgi:hypothetical protein
MKVFAESQSGARKVRATKSRLIDVESQPDVCIAEIAPSAVDVLQIEHHGRDSRKIGARTICILDASQQPTATTEIAFDEVVISETMVTENKTTEISALQSDGAL